VADVVKVRQWFIERNGIAYAGKANAIPFRQ